MWDVICHGTASSLVFISGKLDAANYITNVSIAVPYLRELVNPILQHYNARSHTARAATQFLKEAKVDILL
jgi:hypothetical protein